MIANCVAPSPVSMLCAACSNTALATPIAFRTPLRDKRFKFVAATYQNPPQVPNSSNVHGRPVHDERVKCDLARRVGMVPVPYRTVTLFFFTEAAAGNERIEAAPA